MNRIAQFLILPVCIAYALVFLLQERLFQGTAVQLAPVPTAQFLRATSGYLKQLVAETLFVQSAVFLGGLPAGTDAKTYAPVLAHNYRQVTALYPEFQDPYYYAQAYLAEVGPEFARAANDILATGRGGDPDNLIYPFFQGYNYFRHLDEPIQAAGVFREASRLPEAPPMFAHLAVILSAEGGMLEASIFSLMALVNSTDDKAVRQRYQEELDMFKAAFSVQKAANAFQVERLRSPATLDELVPDYLPALPDFGRAFELTWKPPVVGLKRPMPGK